MRNWDPCSHCRSRSCSKLWGAPFVDDDPLSIDVSEAGPEEVVVDDELDEVLF